MQSRIEAIAEEIRKHNYAYWVLNELIIADDDFNRLMEGLKELAPDHEVLHEVHGSWPDTGRPKVKHDDPLLSLNKVYTDAEVLKWAKGVARDNEERFTIGPKLDGCAGVLYDHGVLASRGDDGTEGENVSDKLPHIDFILRESVKPIRGEVVVTKEFFNSNRDRLARSSGQRYKNTRSACVALLMQEGWPEKLKGLKALTFVDYRAVSQTVTLSTMLDYDWNKLMATMQDLMYPTDGVVIGLQDDDYARSLGSTSHHPRGQLALKFANPTGKTKLIDIVWQVGKDKITPVGLVEPVEISGFENCRLSLHNWDYIKEKDIEIGDHVTIERCGEIIPQLKSVDKRPANRRSGLITKCPACDSPGVRYRKPDLVCTNVHCVGTKAKQLASSLERLGVEGLGLTTVRKLIDIGLDTLPKIFTATVNQFGCLPGFAGRSANILYRGLQAPIISGITEAQLVAALNIQGIGKRFSKELCETITLDNMRGMSYQGFVVYQGLGKTRAEALVNGLAENSELIDWFENNLHVTSIVLREGEQAVQTVCFTGQGPRPRPVLAKEAEAAGFEVLRAVTKKLDYLVCADATRVTNKMKKARSYGTQVLDYDTFIADNLL